MTRLPTVALPNASSDCPPEEIFKFLEKTSHGDLLPLNVITDVNPFNYAPSNLPDGIWFLVSSNEKESAEHGFWKAKREACKLFSSCMITGWWASFEYFDGQVPYEHKTDWVMQEYWITHEGPRENNKAKETSSLCRVFLEDRKQQSTTQTLVHSTELSMQNASSSGSTNKSTVEKDDKTENLAVTGEPANHLALADDDYLSRGDYLELLDLDDPARPSSSSDSSSCVTRSSDEYFDSLALLKELDAEKDANCKFYITPSFRPNEVVMAPASPGSYIGINAPSEEIDATHSPLPALPQVNMEEEAGMSQNGGRKGEKGQKKKHKNKYMCFMPFYFCF